MLIQYNLDNPKGRVAVLTAAFAIAVVMTGLTLRCVIPSALAQANDISTVQAALRYDPRNDRIQNRLGLLYFWSDLDTQKAMPLLRRATQINPQNAQYWADLGMACEAAVDERCADASFLTAAGLAPRVPRLQLALANHYLVASRKSDALLFLRRYLELRPTNPEREFELFLRALGNPDPIWRALPQTPACNARIAFIAYLSQNGDTESANRYWTELMQTGTTVELKTVSSYLNALEGHSQFQQMTKVWRDLQRMGSVRSSVPGNLVFNPGFEQVPSLTGFDWRYQPQKSIALDFVGSNGSEGKHPLQIDFTTGTNSDLELLDQIVPVSPGTIYNLNAVVSSEAITSGSGPRIRVQDLLCPTCLDVSTSDVVGTTQPHELNATFVSGPKTEFLLLSVWRPRSRSYPSEITGRFFVDSISLKPISSSR